MTKSCTPETDKQLIDDDMRPDIINPKHLEDPAVSNMVRVTLSGKTLAESNETIVVENNHYFPPDSVNKALLTDSKTSSICPWKG